MINKKIFSILLLFSITMFSSTSYADSVNTSISGNESVAIKTSSVESKTPSETTNIKKSNDITWNGREDTITYANFLKEVDNNKVKSVIFSADIMENLQARVLFKDGEQKKVYLVSRNLDTFAETLKSKGVDVDVVKSFSDLENESKSPIENGLMTILSLLKTLAYLVMYIVIFVAIMMFVQRKMLGFSSKKNQKINPKDIDVTFNDIAGNDEAKKDIMEVVEFMKNKNKYDKLGAKLPRGILLSGDPGNGKTMLAKAIAKECDAAFFQASGSEFIEVFAGLGASRVRDLFKKARKSKRAVIFIDEIDTIGGKRGNIRSHSEGEQTLNQLLTEMDGFNSHKHEILVVAATNRIDVLDEALLRPGRFDRKIMINKPSHQGRIDILNVYLNKVKIETEGSLDPNIDVDIISRLTVGFSGAELANLVNEALIRAAKKDSNCLTQQDLLDARNKILLGDPRADIKMVEKERRITAIHESGHAIVSLVVSKDPIETVTITPHGMALGFVLRVPEKENWMVSKDSLNKEMQVLMGGRAAEDLILGENTTGAMSDMEKAYEMAMSMTTKWGMGEVLANISVKELNSLSDGTRKDVDREVIELVRSNYDQAKTILSRYPKVMDRMVSILMEKESIDKDDVVKIWKEETDEDPYWIKIQPYSL
ncbi:ATP-dependent metallopeptidase FtsH/Yme1/Tma family protein [Shigella flexneri]